MAEASGAKRQVGFLHGTQRPLHGWWCSIGLSFAVVLYGFDQAYAYCSVRILQLMKAANAAIVFCFSCLPGLQVMNRQRLFVIAWMAFGSSMCVVGDVHFVLVVSSFRQCRSVRNSQGLSWRSGS